MYISQDILVPYVAHGLIAEQIHPLASHLHIYNYTHSCQYTGAWDDVTMNCRGLVLDIKQERVVSACLKKFFNYEEHIQQGSPLPSGIPVVFEKMDGWYGSLYWIRGEPWIATRGSFASPGAQWATQWFRDAYSIMGRSTRLYWTNPCVTHIFEIIAPVTRIVVQYNFEGLVHLATLNQQSGEDIWPLVTPGGMRNATRIATEDYRTLQGQNLENAEGFVCFFPQSQLRLKIKFAAYVALHRIITGLSVHALWEMWGDGKTLISTLEDVPEAMHSWIIRQYFVFTNARIARDKQVINLYLDIMLNQLSRSWGKDRTARQKEIALKFQEHPEDAAFLFQWHKYQDMLWKTVEPSGSETFRQENEEGMQASKAGNEAE